MTGIYKFENKNTHLVYIGQSINIEERYKSHLKEIKQNRMHTKFYNAVREEGIENFTFKVIEECPIEELNIKEKYWINYYDSYHNGYNSTIGGSERGSSQKLTDFQLKEIYQLLIDNRLSYAEIANKYNISIRILYYINSGKSYKDNKLSYPLRERKSWKGTKLCPVCGKPILQNSNNCFSCAMNLLKINPPVSREDLKKLIRTLPFLQIGKKYNVSDNAVRKWCDKYNLPRTKTAINSYSDKDWNLL